MPDPDRRWGDDLPATGRTDGGGTDTGCRFADRCPFVMAQCREAPPPLYRTGPHRAVACYLYRGGVETVKGDITAVFRPPATAGSVAG